MLALWLVWGPRAAEFAGLGADDWSTCAPDSSFTDLSYLPSGDFELPVGRVELKHQWSEEHRDYVGTKNGRSRTLWCGPHAAAHVAWLIESGKEMQAAAKRAHRPWWNGTHGIPLFVGRDGRPANPQLLNNSLKRIFLRANFSPMRSIVLAHLHGLRHLAGSLYYQNSGWNDLATAALLGVTSDIIRTVYAMVPRPHIVQTQLLTERMAAQAPQQRRLAETGELSKLHEYVGLAKAGGAREDLAVVRVQMQAAYESMGRIYGALNGDLPPHIQSQLRHVQHELAQAEAWSQRSLPDWGPPEL